MAKCSITVRVESDILDSLRSEAASNTRSLSFVTERRLREWMLLSVPQEVEHACEECGAKVPPRTLHLCGDVFTRLVLDGDAARA